MFYKQYKNFPRKSGIYIIKNLVNSKVYIGQSSCLRQRVYNHLYTLKLGNHSNSHLQSSLDKYGKENFIFEVLELIDPEHLDSREQYWIDYYQSYNRNKGYNKSPIAEIARNYKIDKKILENRGRIFTLVSPEGQVFNGKNVSLFCEEFLLDKKGITTILNKPNSSYKGWTTSLKDYNFLKKYGSLRNRSRQKVKVKSPLGEEIEVFNKKDFAIKNNLDPSSFNLLTNGKKDSYKGWSLIQVIGDR